LLRGVVLVAVEVLAQRRGVESALEAALVAVLEAVEVLEHLAADRLREVGGRLALADHRARAQPDEGAQPGEMARQQLVHRGPVALGGLLHELTRILAHRPPSSAAGRAMSMDRRSSGTSTIFASGAGVTRAASVPNARTRTSPAFTPRATKRPAPSVQPSLQAKSSSWPSSCSRSGISPIPSQAATCTWQPRTRRPAASRTITSISPHGGGEKSSG